MPRIGNRIQFEKIEEIVVRDDRLLCTMFSYAMIALMFVNISLFHLSVIGITASFLYFLINAIFLGNAFFQKEDRFMRFMLGSLLLIVFLGVAGWVVMMIFNLDTIRSTIVLCIATTSSSAMSKTRSLSG